MVVKKAWIPGKGTYSISTSENPIDPTIGDLSYQEAAPKDEAGENGGDTMSRLEDILSGNHDLEEFLNIASLANLAHVHNSDDEWKARGDPTDIAIQVFAARFNWNRARLTAEETPPGHNEQSTHSTRA